MSQTFHLTLAMVTNNFSFNLGNGPLFTHAHMHIYTYTHIHAQYAMLRRLRLNKEFTTALVKCTCGVCCMVSILEIITTDLTQNTKF